MKMAHVTPVYKEASRSVEDNYLPVSTFPNVSKVFGRFLHKQVSPYFFWSTFSRFILLNWYLLHARLNSHCKHRFTKKSTKKSV